MAMTTAMMMRVTLVAIGRHLVAITVGMADFSGAVGINTNDRLHRVRDRSDSKGQEHGQTREKDRQSMHLSVFNNYRLIEASESCAEPSLGGFRRSSSRAWLMICRPPQMPSAAVIKATARSGWAVPVPTTPAAASRTARLPIASLREQIQTDHILALPLR